MERPGSGQEKKGSKAGHMPRYYTEGAKEIRHDADESDPSRPNRGLPEKLRDGNEPFVSLEGMADPRTEEGTEEYEDRQWNSEDDVTESDLMGDRGKREEAKKSAWINPEAEAENRRNIGKSGTLNLKAPRKFGADKGLGKKAGEPMLVDVEVKKNKSYSAEDAERVREERENPEGGDRRKAA